MFTLPVLVVLLHVTMLVDGMDRLKVRKHFLDNKPYDLQNDATSGTGHSRGGHCRRQDQDCGGLVVAVPGPQGPPGPLGQAGHPGVQGVQGVQGQGGLPGISGLDGSNGAKGERGVKGVKGEAGRTVFRSAPDHPRVAFSATMDEDMSRAAEYRVVKYNLLLTNQGDAFDLGTGVFTAPANGTYMIGFSGVSYHGQDILLHLIRNGKRLLSAFDNSGCSCCGKTSGKCAGSASNVGILGLAEGDQIWVELPDAHGLHNAQFHNYASFYGYMLFPN